MQRAFLTRWHSFTPELSKSFSSIQFHTAAPGEAGMHYSGAREHLASVSYSNCGIKAVWLAGIKIIAVLSRLPLPRVPSTASPLRAALRRATHSYTRTLFRKWASAAGIVSLKQTGSNSISRGGPKSACLERRFESFDLYFLSPCRFSSGFFSFLQWQPVHWLRWIAPRYE